MTEDKTRDNLVKSYLKKERRKVLGLGQGVHKNQFYYGSTIEVDGKTLDCIVTSSRNIFIDYTQNGRLKEKSNEIRNRFGLNYRFRFFEDVLDFSWTRNSISKWLFDNYTVDIKEVFDKLVSTNKRFMIYEDERAHKFVALDIMRSYWFQLFPANGRSFYNAEKESGKTNQIMVYKAFSFNPTTSADFSSASIYRIIESTGATILFDDFDELPETQKLAVIRHIRVNYKRFKTIRADGGGGKSFNPTAYNSFSHLVFNNVFGLGNDFITISRLIIVRLLRHQDAKDLTFDPESAEWTPLRNELHVCGLQYWKEISDNYNTMKVDGLASRYLEIFKPILAIAMTISEELYQEILEWYKEIIQKEAVRDISEDWEYLMLRELWLQMATAGNEMEVPVRDIAHVVAGGLEYNKLSEALFKRKMHSLTITLGKKLKSYLIFKSTRKTGLAYYTITKEGLEKIINSRGFWEDIVKVEEEPKKEDLDIEV